MNAIGPVEPGEGTRDQPLHTEATGGSAARPLVLFYRAHRRAAHGALAAALLLAAGGYLYASRPPAVHPVRAELPFPAQTVDVSYLGEAALPPGARPHSFAFEVLLGVESGPAVTVTRVTQPYDGLSVASTPPPPFRTTPGAARKVVVTMHVTECGKVPKDAGLPFLDVTLRNARAIQVQSFILGPRYARDLSHALQVACSNDFA
ncbi:Tat pathway signal sequence domain protein [Streptomyces sp. NPDC021608]|uniref:Tat pathway signal sequence domain protein n=1 Tax=Streptomyces sp. NPDC021608 TaxID=3154903 RepID=UPI0033CBFFF1